MNDAEKLTKARRAIFILSAILGILLILLLCLYFYIQKAEEHAQLSVSTGNYIATSQPPGTNSEASLPDETPESTDDQEEGSSSSRTSSRRAAAVSVPAAAADDDVSLALYALHAGDSEAFSVENMFPGDVVSKRYYVRAYCKNDIDVKFRVTVRKGYEKLAEVLMMRVEDPSTGNVMYEGLMCDMTDTVTRRLETSRNGTESLAYAITVYLDTSVGNEYMSLPLIADFEWWTDNRGSLIPKTGDAAMPLLWGAVFLGSAAAVTFVVIVKRRRERSAEEQDGT